MYPFNRTAESVQASVWWHTLHRGARVAGPVATETRGAMISGVGGAGMPPRRSDPAAVTRFRFHPDPGTRWAPRAERTVVLRMVT